MITIQKPDIAVLVEQVAMDLLKITNQVTTLEVKSEILKQAPFLHLTQDMVSKAMADLYKNGSVSYTDNGTFRIYSMPVQVDADAKLSTKDKKKVKKMLKKEKLAKLLKSLITPMNLGQQNDVIKEVASILKLKL